MAFTLPACIKRTAFYAALRAHYHKHIAYRRLNPQWDLRENVVSITVNDADIQFRLTSETNRRYARPIYKCEPLGFYTHELPGYLKGVQPADLNGTVLDVGAYQGAFAVYLKLALQHSGRIICFEPVAGNHVVLRENLDLNRITDVDVIPLGAWKERGTVQFEDAGEVSSISRSGDVRVDVTDIDSELARLGVAPDDVRFVKMDIEGAEVEAIDGMTQLLTEGSPRLAIATYHVRDGRQTCIEVERKLKALGYATETGYPRHLTTWAWKDRP